MMIDCMPARVFDFFDFMNVRLYDCHGKKRTTQHKQSVFGALSSSRVDSHTDDQWCNNTVKQSNSQKVKNVQRIQDVSIKGFEGFKRIQRDSFKGTKGNRKVSR